MVDGGDALFLGRFEHYSVLGVESFSSLDSVKKAYR